MSNTDERIEKLKKLIGTKYQRYDDNGNALGCTFPVYFLYPNLLHYKEAQNNKIETYLKYLRENLIEVKKEDIQKGDIIVFQFPFDNLHFAVYIGNNEIIHVMNDDSLQICKLSFFMKKFKSAFRVVK